MPQLLKANKIIVYVVRLLAGKNNHTDNFINVFNLGGCMRKHKIGEDGEIIEMQRDGTSNLVAIVVAIIGALGLIIASAVGGVAIYNEISNGSNTLIIITATPNETSIAAQTSIPVAETPISESTRLAQPTPTSRPPQTAIPTDIPLSSILYENNFEDGKTNGLRTELGSWRIVTEDNGNRVLQAESNRDGWWSIAHIGSADWTDYAIEASYRFVNYGSVDIGFRIRNTVDGYALGTNSDSVQLKQLWEDSDYGWHVVETFFIEPIIADENGWNKVFIVVNDDSIRTSFNDQWLSDVWDNDDDRYSTGWVSLRADSGAVVWFDNIRIWKLD